jgi:hypothetical protein
MALRGKKLRGNGIWEASRMMLPEHKLAIRTHRTRLLEQVKPELDDQRTEEMSILLNEAHEEHVSASITTYGLYANETHMGQVVKIDPIEGIVKLVCVGETLWIMFENILHVELHRTYSEC